MPQAQDNDREGGLSPALARTALGQQTWTPEDRQVWVQKTNWETYQQVVCLNRPYQYF